MTARWNLGAPLVAAFVWLLVMTGAMSGAAHAHWQDQPPHQIARLGPFDFERGGSIPDLRISYVTHGKLNAAKDNAILVLHGHGGNHHVLDHHIGPGRALDTDKYFVICSDLLGATQTGYEHSSSATNSGLKMKFPQYNGRDMIRSQHLLVTQALGIPRLLAVVGVSSGASHAEQFAVSYPGFIDGIVPIVGGSLGANTGYHLRSATMDSILENCAGWLAGDYDVNPPTCARDSISVLVGYFYSRDWWDEHIDTPEAYQRWRIAMGAYYIDVQDARDLHYLNRSYGNGWIGDTPGFNGDGKAALASIKAKALFIYSLHDQIFPPKMVEAAIRAIPGAKGLLIDSSAAHTIWYNADPQATVAVGAAMRDFFATLSTSRSASR